MCSKVSCSPTFMLVRAISSHGISLRCPEIGGCTSIRSITRVSKPAFRDEQRENKTRCRTQVHARDPRCGGTAVAGQAHREYETPARAHHHGKWIQGFWRDNPTHTIEFHAVMRNCQRAEPFTHCIRLPCHHKTARGLLLRMATIARRSNLHLRRRNPAVAV